MQEFHLSVVALVVILWIPGEPSSAQTIQDVTSDDDGGPTTTTELYPSDTIAPNNLSALPNLTYLSTANGSDSALGIFLKLMKTRHYDLGLPPTQPDGKLLRINNAI